MRPDGLERYSLGSGPLHRLGARGKLVATIVVVVVIVATPIGAWRWLVGEALGLAFVVGISGIPPRAILSRWLGFVILVGFLALVVAQNHAERPALGIGGVALGLLAKNSLAFVAVLTLSGVTPFPKILSGLRGLGLPAMLVATLHFMYRYIHVLGEELDRMVKARRSRSFRRSGRLDWGLLTGLIGVLFLRAFERGERVHAAMVSRGWEGDLRVLEGLASE
jgi:cobalt/nickel transport system permease protein